MSGAGKLTASFRKAGLNYLEYLNTQTTALRSVLKEPMRSEVMGRTTFSYRAFTYPAGVESTPRALRCDCSTPTNLMLYFLQFW